MSAILVTGANGFVGGTLIRRLLEKGHDVRGLTRHPDQRKNPLAPTIPLLPGSVSDPESVAKAMEGIEAVIHLVGILAPAPGNSFEQAHVAGTRNVVEAAKAAGVSRYLHMSALGTRPNAASQYHQTKWRAEEIVRASGLDFTIFRPSVIFGPHDAFVNLFARMARFSPALPLMGDGQAKMQPVHVDDVAEAFALALEKPETVGQTFEMGGGAALTFRAILETICAALGKRRLLLKVPFPVLRAEAALFETFLPSPPLTRDQLIMAAEDNICDIESVRKTFGIDPKIFNMKILDWL